MPSDKVQKLKELLERLNRGEPPESVKAEAREFLASVDPAELSAAEQALIDEGLDPAELRNLCGAHLAVLDDELRGVRTSLQPGHVLDTMMKEHDAILRLLDEIERADAAVQKAESLPACGDVLPALEHAAAHLPEAEPHHAREEQVLFPELEKRGVTGPPRIMRMEHELLRENKRVLKDLVGRAKAMDFGAFKRQLHEVAAELVSVLREHIFKENTILYPTALQVIQDARVWAAMKDDCDRIGYCCFTPGTRE